MVIVPILLAVFLYALSTVKAARIIALSAQAVLTGFAVYLFFLTKAGEITADVGGYEGVLGITLRADTLSSVFVALVTFSFLIAALYSVNEEKGKLFWFLLFIWEGLLIGLFLTRDFFNVFVLLEVAAVVVSIMIMFKRDTRSMYDGMFFLMVSTVAMQFYLIGVGFVYRLTGVLDMEAAGEVLATLDKSAQILPYALIMTAISLKCALLPLYSWLPKAHGTPSAPSAVSALLSGVHIKTGVYLFVRTQAIFSEVDASSFFLWLGIITSIVGFIFAISQTDIKLILAYHTISQVGLIIAGLNLSGDYSQIGGLYHAVNHALFKASLFLSAGLIIKAYGTRNIYEIRGVFRRYPLIGAATLMAVFGITGAPLFNGSISKYFIMYGTNRVITVALVVINLGTIISFIKYSTMLFGSTDADRELAKPGKLGQVAVLILGAVCFVGGILGAQLIYLLFNVRLSVDPAGYFEKTVIFFACGVAGYLIYRFYVKKSALIKRIREIDLSFRGVCICIGSFFATVLIAVNFLV